MTSLVMLTLVTWIRWCLVSFLNYHSILEISIIYRNVRTLIFQLKKSFSLGRNNSDNFATLLSTSNSLISKQHGQSCILMCCNFSHKLDEFFFFFTFTLCHLRHTIEYLNLFWLIQVHLLQNMNWMLENIHYSSPELQYQEYLMQELTFSHVWSYTVLLAIVCIHCKISYVQRTSSNFHIWCQRNFDRQYSVYYHCESFTWTYSW